MINHDKPIGYLYISHDVHICDILYIKYGGDNPIINLNHDEPNGIKYTVLICDKHAGIQLAQTFKWIESGQDELQVRNSSEVPPRIQEVYLNDSQILKAVSSKRKKLNTLVFRKKTFGRFLHGNGESALWQQEHGIYK